MEMTLNSLGRKVPLELPGAGSFAPYISPFAMLGRPGAVGGTQMQLRRPTPSRSKVIENIEKAAGVITDCLRGDGKVLFCGNGGSAADAQHLAAELSGRFYYDRPPLFAEALHVNTTYLTAVANDYS